MNFSLIARKKRN